MFVNYIFHSNIYRTFDNQDEAMKLEKELAQNNIVSVTFSKEDFLKFYMGLMGQYNTSAKA